MSAAEHDQVCARTTRLIVGRARREAQIGRPQAGDLSSQVRDSVASIRSRANGSTGPSGLVRRLLRTDRRLASEYVVNPLSVRLRETHEGRHRNQPPRWLVGIAGSCRLRGRSSTCDLQAMSPIADASGSLSGPLELQLRYCRRAMRSQFPRIRRPPRFPGHARVRTAV